jgi:hypothetical protein
MPVADYTPMIVLLSILIPVGVVGIVLGSIALLTYHFRATQALRIGGELVQQMLQRDKTADDIERVLLAWHADATLAGKFKNEKPPLKKMVA